MRRFDKRKNIMEANLRLEESYLSERGFKYFTDISDEEFFDILIESCDEIGVEYDKNILNEEKQNLNEAIGLLITGAILASGKLLDIVGTIFRKIFNAFTRGARAESASKKCSKFNDDKEKAARCYTLLYQKGELKKTLFEEWGEWIHKNIIMRLFKGAAILLLDVAAGIFQKEPNKVDQDYYGFKTVSNLKWSDDKELVDKVANTLFYLSIAAVGTTGVVELISHGLHGLATFSGVTELVSVGTKSYEILLLIIALIIIFRGKVKKKDPTQVAHSLGECLEAGGSFKTLMKKVKQMKKDDTWAQEVLTCVDKSAELAHH